MLTSRLGSFEGLRLADLFAGTGALGLEALSRGAVHCTFVENDRDALIALRGNVAKFGTEDCCDIRAQSALALWPIVKPLDLIVMDPPYAVGAAATVLELLLAKGWIGPASWIAVETARNEMLAIEGLAEEARRSHGKASITLLRGG